VIFVHELNIAAIKELFVLLKLIHFFSLISCSYTILYKNSNFSLSWALPNLVQKLWPCIHAQNMQKAGFEFYIMWNFVKKNYLFRKNSQFCAKLVSYGYRIDAKFHAIKVISCKNMYLLVRKNYILFRENPIFYALLENLAKCL